MTDDSCTVKDGRDGPMPDVTEKVERTDVGFRLTVESSRGDGRDDRDKVKAELRTEDYPDWDTLLDMKDDVAQLMEYRRAHQPDEEDGDD